MASMMKKAMIYLGLGPDEEYEQYDDHAAAPSTRGSRSPGGAAGSDEGQTAAPAPTAPRPTVRQSVEDQPLVHPQPQTPSGTVRPIVTDDPTSSTPPRATSARAVPTHQERPPPVSSAVRTIGPAITMPHAVSPTSFNDAQEIGDRFKVGQPVIVNLQAVDRDLRRRLVDFSSGLCYAIAGKMERVADQVYLLTPADVEVPPEETRRHID